MVEQDGVEVNMEMEKTVFVDVDAIRLVIVDKIPKFKRSSLTICGG